MLEEISQNGDCFGDAIVVPEGETSLVFGLRSRHLARILTSDRDSALSELHGKGHIREVCIKYTDEIDKAWLGFAHLMVLVTRRCNLACRYCYGTALPNGPSLPIATALKAVDWYFEPPPKRPSVGFHGGGEPTLEMDLIKAVFHRVKEHDARARHFGIITNGTLPESALDWFMANKFNINISWDGPPTIQNRNRPTVSGGPSAPILEETARRLREREYGFTARSTVCSNEDIIDVVDYFADQQVPRVKLEPLFPHGRCYSHIGFNNEPLLNPPSANELVDIMVRALDRAAQLGINLSSSSFEGDGLPMMHGSVFCGAASGRTLAVTHEGYLSACSEALEVSDSTASPFLFGICRPGISGIQLDQDKLSNLLKRHVNNIPECRKCFARLACGAGCAIKAVRSSGSLYGIEPQHCSYMRLLIPRLIRRSAKIRGV